MMCNLKEVIVMATNLQIDDKIIETAVKLGKHKTKKAAVTKALVEYIDHLKQEKILSMFGMVALTGVVVNDSLILIDLINRMRADGATIDQAIRESGERRFRPILLTTATTVGGLIPLWLGGGPMFEPMAIVIIFGLLFATFLTLGLVPTLYSVFYGVQFRGFEPGQQGAANLRPDAG